MCFINCSVQKNNWVLHMVLLLILENFFAFTLNNHHFKHELKISIFYKLKIKPPGFMSDMSIGTHNL